jgi:hypothetical protein
MTGRKGWSGSPDTDISRFEYEQTLLRGFNLWSVFALAAHAARGA